MNLARNYGIRCATLVCLLSPLASANAQQVALSQPTPTIWRFMGIPQGIQKLRDVTTNRHGNHPGFERKPPLTRIADPANLLSTNPAIKAAAEIKAAEDMKKQKIKAIKYLATIGCGCYDQDGKVTDALIAATYDCTPDVRKAAIEAINEAADGACCGRCGSKSCCNEAITNRLSEIAYERDENGCYLEPSAEIRHLACVVLHKCCPNGPPMGPIEEEMIDEQAIQREMLPTPAPQIDEPQLEGESDGSDDVEPIRGESTTGADRGRGPNAEHPKPNVTEADVVHRETDIKGTQGEVRNEASRDLPSQFDAPKMSYRDSALILRVHTPELVEVEVEPIGGNAGYHSRGKVTPVGF